MLNGHKKQMLARALIGGLIGAALMLAVVHILDAIPWMGHIWTFRNPFSVWADWFRYSSYPLDPLVNLCLSFLTGAEIGIATLPFADSGRELVLRSLAHFAVMSATVGAWAWLNFGLVEVPFFLILLALIYAVVWLVRWVGWYVELNAIRKKLGLTRKKEGKRREE